MAQARLKDIVDGMEFQTDEMTAYLHRPTGRVVVVSDEAFAAADEGDEEWVAPEELAEAKTSVPMMRTMSRFPIALKSMSIT